MDKSKIQKEAKEILDKFASALSKVKTGDDFYVDREEFERVEGKVEKRDKCEDWGDFKESLLENAPKKDKDFVIAEKGGWK